jgi:cell division initiation protein
VAELEWYMRENEELQANIAGLESRINHYKGLEETLKNAIVLAQKAADQIKESATREADAIIEEARRQADIIKEQAEEIRRKAYEEIEEQRQKAMRFKTEMRTLLNSTLEMLDKNVNSITRVLEGDNNRNDWR